MYIYILKIFKNPKLRQIACVTIALINLANGSLIFVSVVIFGYKSKDKHWMPNIQFNWPSWGYGLAILAGFFSFITSLYINKQAQIEKIDHQFHVHIFPLVSEVKS